MSKLSLVTRAEFEKLPEVHVELIEGRVVMAPAPVNWHGQLVQRLMFALGDWLGQDGRDRVLTAPFDVSIDNHNVYQPDVLVLPEGTRPTGIDWEAPTPIWVGEVISPSTAKRDRSKLPHYADEGVEEAWLIYPRTERVEIHALQTGTITEHGRGEAVQSSVLDGFSLDLDQLFRVAR